MSFFFFFGVDIYVQYTTDNLLFTSLPVAPGH